MLTQYFLENSAAHWPDKIAIICDEKRYTYRQINDSADNLSASLIQMGMAHQDRVIIFLENSTEAVISVFGCLKAGVIFIIINPATKKKKLNYILKDSGAKALITHRDKANIVNDILGNTNDLEHIIWCGGKEKQESFLLNESISDGPKMKNWSEVIEENEMPNLTMSTNICDDDLSNIIYTSGSTGDPKGVMAAHYNVVAATRSIVEYLENDEHDIIYSVLPLSFDYGLYQIFICFFSGSTIILKRSFTYPFAIIKEIIREKVTGLPLVPTMAAILIQMETLEGYDFKALRYITNTGDTLPVPYIRKLQSIFSQAKIFSMYGLTECKRVSYLPPSELDARPDSVGIPIPNTQAFIVDKDHKKVKSGQIGELVVKGAHVMQGYWNSPEETARIFHKGEKRGEDTLYTGDLFKRDTENFLYFVARKDDLIKVKGERVSPKEIENILCDIDEIIAACIINIPHKLYGNILKAYIVTEKNKTISEEKIISFCKENLESFFCPKYIEFLEELPKTSNGKIDKKQLREIYETNL